MTDGLILKMAAEKQTNTEFNYLLHERAWLSQYGACHFTSAARVRVALVENNGCEQVIANKKKVTERNDKDLGKY